MKRYKTFVLAAGYSIQHQCTQKLRIIERIPINRVKRRGKTLCWRSASSLTRYRNRRAADQALEDKVASIVKAEDERIKSAIIAGVIP